MKENGQPIPTLFHPASQRRPNGGRLRHPHSAPNPRVWASTRTTPRVVAKPKVNTASNCNALCNSRRHIARRGIERLGWTFRGFQLLRHYLSGHCCPSPALFSEPNRLTSNQTESESESESQRPITRRSMLRCSHTCSLLRRTHTL
jgi:hypothetical protein